MINLRQNWKSMLNWLGWLTAALFFLITFWRLLQQENWQTIYQIARWFYFVIACSLLLAGLFFRSLSGKVAHMTLGFPLTIEQSYRFWFMSQLAKYVPGSVWQFATRGSLYAHNGMPVLLSAAVILWETVIILLVGIFMVFTSGIALTDSNRLLLIGATIVLLALCWLTLTRWLWRRLTGLGLPLAGKMLATIDHLGARRYRAALALTMLALVSWALINIGFHFVILTFIQEPSVSLEQSFFVYPLAWIIGFIVIIAPGGLGVRELVLVAFFAPLVGDGVAIMISVMSRLWWMLAEGIHILLAFLLSRRHRTRESVV